ncbi:MauE/DoxX family redox-associated membrane protein [Arthrobacter sp. B2a2-09]|uniref:MauE/DoxX family redox-associated membrane protein n=1 Tax=Arthrobacter sp. B2a2-09 TaxID=2952822 RepID=UPI0022CD8D57|nr:MauE/DoxX family redox-associated membrane protein [Arthrobacter sp. B2a2-09]
MTVLRVAVTMVFLLAVAGKLSAPRSFSNYLRGLGVAGTWIGAVFATIVVAELSTAGLLLLPELDPVGPVSATALSLGFVILQLLGLRRRSGACSCFGHIDDHQMPGVGAVRAVLLLAASAVLLGDIESSFMDWHQLLVGILAAISFIQAFGLANSLLRLVDYRQRLRKELSWDPRSGQATQERTEPA